MGLRLSTSTIGVRFDAVHGDFPLAQLPDRRGLVARRHRRRLFAFLANRDQSPALIIAHRGSSAIAPENTLAAFRLAADQHTDFVELDVQESADGQVLVVHDSDLMKVGGNPTKIWDGDAATLALGRYW